MISASVIAIAEENGVQSLRSSGKKNGVLKIYAREFFPASSSTGERISWMNRLFMKKCIFYVKCGFSFHLRL